MTPQTPQTPGAAGAAGRESTEPRTYGHHQEQAAAALNQLVVTDALPLGDDAAHAALAARVRVIDNLRDRCQALGAPRQPTKFEDAAVRRQDLVWIQQWPLTTLDHVVGGLPRPTTYPDDDRRGLDLGPSGDAAVVLWHQAADHLLLANHALEQAEEQPWRTEPGPAWHIIGDTTACTEAVAVLDDRLREVGLLSGPDYAPAPGTVSSSTADWSLEQRRLVTSQQMRTAGWYANGAAVDLAAPSAGRRGAAEPVRPVQEISDAAPAQRQLARQLTPANADNAFVDAYQRMDTATFRGVVRNQELLCTSMHELLQNRPGAGQPAAAFARLRDHFADLDKHSSRLRDDQPRGSNNRALWQQREISQGTRRLSYLRGIEPAQAMDLASATHQVLRNLAAMTRLEASRDNSNLRLNPDSGRVSHTTSLGRTLTAAARSHAPTAPTATWLRPVQRDALRATLDATPTHTRAPHPSHTPRRTGPSL